MPGYTNPQNLNRYSYVSNNPLRYTDPTGHAMSDGGGGGHCDLNCVQVHNQNNNHGGGGGNGGHHNDDDNNVPATPSLLDPEPEEFNELHCFNNPYFCGEGAPTLTSPTTTTGHSPTINWDAVVDPLAWEHIAGAVIGGVVLIIFGAAVMIPMGVELCTSIVGCVGGIFLVAAGGLAVIGGGALIWSGIQFTRVYLDEVFVEEP